MKQRVKSYCEARGLLQKGDAVLVGVSGGADSVCLLFLLHELQEELGLSLRALHVHHGIRSEAGRDAEFARDLCERWNVPFTLVQVNVPELAKKEGISEEEAGRTARYQAFEEAAKEWMAQEQGPSSVKIALAHHAGDRAETMLFHLFRGSGLKGLSSIPPMRETKTAGVSIIRPLLFLERSEIEGYLDQNDLSHVEDATNAEDAYARNRIRHHVLPYAEEEICSGAARHVNQAADLLLEVEEHLAQETAQARNDCVSEGRISAELFIKLPGLIQKRLILELLTEASPHGKDIGAKHVEMVRDLFFGETGRKVSLPFGIIARREYGFVVLERASEERSEGHDEIEIPLESTLKPEGFTANLGQETYHFRAFPYEKNEIIPEKTYTKWFDYDKIKNTLLLRTRRPGDYLMIRGKDGVALRKALKDYFITEKFPRKIREEIPLLAEGSHVLWITGHRISEAYKVDEDTRTILQVKREMKRRN